MRQGDKRVKEWFATTKPWDSVDYRIIDALIVAFSKKELLFEVFVLTSMENDLVREYIEIS